MDEQMIADMAKAIEREFYAAVDDAASRGPQAFERVARAAHSVIAGKVAELEEWRNRCEYLLACIDMSNEAGAPVDESDPEDIAAMDEIRAALAPYPERRSEPHE